MCTTVRGCGSLTVFVGRDEDAVLPAASGVV